MINIESPLQQQLKGLCDGSGRTQKNALLMLNTVKGSLVTHGLYGTPKQVPALTQLIIRLILSNHHQQQIDGLFFLLNQLIPRVSPAFLQLSVDKVGEEIMKLLNKPNQHPSILISVSAVTLQLIRTFPQTELSERLLELIVKKLTGKKATQRIARDLAVFSQENSSTRNVLARMLMAQIQTCQSSETINNLARASASLMKTFNREQTDTIIDRLLNNHDIQFILQALQVLSPIINSSHVAGKALQKLLNADYTQNQQQMVSTAVEIFKALTRTDPFQAGRVMPAWLSLISRHCITFAQEIHEIIQDLEFGSRDELDLDNLQISEPSSVQRAEAIFSQLIEDLNASHPKEVSTIVSAFIKKLPIKYKENILRILLCMSQIPCKSYSWMASIFQIAIKKIGCQPILIKFPIQLQGDPSDETFEQNNNIWLADIISKLSKVGNLEDFQTFIGPLLNQIDCLIKQELIVLKKKFYENLQKRLWSCFKALSKFQYGRTATLFLYQLAKYPLTQEILQGMSCMAEHSLDIACDIGPQKVVSSLSQSLQKYEGQMAVSIVKCISKFANICSEEYLNRVFTKNALALSSQLDFKQHKNNKFKANLKVLISLAFKLVFNNESIVVKSPPLTQREVTILLVEKLISHDYPKDGLKLLKEVTHSTSNIHNDTIMDLILKSDPQPSSSHIRIYIYDMIWAKNQYHNLKDQSVSSFLSFIKAITPQIITGLRINKLKARQSAAKMLLVMAEKMQEIGLMEEYIQLLTVGLVGNTIMKADAIRAITLVMQNLCRKMELPLVRDVMQLFICLFKDEKSQIFKGLIIFGKKVGMILPPVIVTSLLPRYLTSVFQTSEGLRHDFRHPIKHMLLKLAKKVGVDKLQAMIPEQSHKFLKNTLKQSRRQKRAQARRRKQFRQHNNLYGQSQSQSSKEEGQKGMDVEDEEPDQWPVNYFDSHYESNKQNITSQQVQKDIFASKPEKRQRRDDDLEREAAQVGVNRVFKKVKKDQGIHIMKVDSKIYRSEGGGGDRQVKGKPKPVSFMQLNPKALNKRFSKRAAHVFEEIIGHGGLKGLKERIQRK